MKTKKTEQQTIESIVNAVATLFMAHNLMVEGIQRLDKFKQEPNTGDLVHNILRGYEPYFYFGAAALMMNSTFGTKGELRELADKALKSMVEHDVNKEGE